MNAIPAIRPEATLAELAVLRPGASRVFHRHGLDFCCHGRIPLREACARRELAVEALVAEIEAEAQPGEASVRWDEKPLPELINHILSRYHERHREELPRLLAMARKVEAVHADKASSPRGLAALLEEAHGAMESHMQKEEFVLFPLIRSGRGALAAFPVRAMEAEHEDHGRNLALLRERCRGYVAPPEACETWRALYLGLHELEQELMEHIHLEKNVLFPRALRS
ncbi:MAG: iron-sulfur cluster repair protein YtfE [Planctomycetota bacterium]